MASTIVQGASTTQIEFEMGVDLQKAVDDVRSKVDQTRAVLPKEVDEPIVQRLEITSAPIITYAVAATVALASAGPILRRGRAYGDSRFVCGIHARTGC